MTKADRRAARTERASPRAQRSRPAVTPRWRRLLFDCLEHRIALSVTAGLSGDDSGSVLTDVFTVAEVSALKTGIFAKAGQVIYDLANEYDQYRTSGTTTAFQSRWSNAFAVPDAAIDVYLQGSGDFTNFKQVIAGAGLSILNSDAKRDVIVATVPLARLSEIVALPDLVTMNPVDRPVTKSVGSANNQGQQAMYADLLTAQSGATGFGQTVGVLSNSVNSVGGGLADSVASGDLPSNVQVIQDGPSGSTDEGRAMLEVVHDVAPDANLAFATAVYGQLGFAQNIDALRTMAHATVLVDDISYFLEPQFQPGVIDEAIKRATNANIPYFSAMGNTASDGYQSPLRFYQNGANLEQDWNPGIGQDNTLRITVQNSDTLFFQWDNPYDGVTGAATADLDVFLRNTSGTVVASGVTNNLITRTPYESLNVPSAGTYDIVVRYVGGTAQPTRLSFCSFGNLGITSVEYTSSDQFQSGAAGHAAGPYTISVGAVPFYNAPYFAPLALTINSDSFSSRGPYLQVFDDNGARLLTPQYLQKPDISAIDGINNTLLGSDSSQDTDSLPNFFGTSAAAPNAAAVAALLKQVNSNITIGRLKSALVTTASPVNGSLSGHWDPVGGYGLINAMAAVNSLSATVQPVMDVSAYGISIAVADLTPSITDGTNFGSVSTANGTATRVFTIANIGAVPLSLTSTPTVLISGAQAADFSVVFAPSSTTIAAGGSTTFQMVFTPQATGLRQAVLHVASTLYDYWFSVSGTGIVGAAPEMEIRGQGNTIFDGDATPSATDGSDFGAAVLGASSVNEDFMINNLGSAILNLISSPRVVIDGLNSADFIVSIQPNATVAAGSSSNFRITFSPTALGVRTANVHVFANDADEPVYDFAIQGTARLPGIAGRLWNDLDRNGAINGNESPAVGEQVFLDANGNGVFDQGELTTTTAVDGSYQFTGLAAGIYDVAVAVRPTYYVTSPTAGHLSISFATDVSNVNFGIRLNTAPVLDTSGTPMLLANEDDTNSAGTTIPALLATGTGGNPITDVDTVNRRGIAIVGTDETHGLWQYSLNGGALWQQLGSVVPTSALLLADDPLIRLRFLPTRNFSGDIAAALSFRAWDQTQGTNGTLFDVTNNGGVTPFSAEVEAASVTVIGSDDAPNVSAPGRQGTRPDMSLALSSANSNPIQVSDVDSAQLSLTVSAVGGTLRLATRAGLDTVSGDDSALVTMSGASVSLNTALDGLIFTPTSGFRGDAAILVVANDNSTGSGGPKIATGLVLISVRDAFSVEGSKLFITGTAAADQATFNYVSDTLLWVTLDGVTQVYDPRTVTQVTASLGGGQDVAVVVGSPSAEVTTLAPQRVTLTTSSRSLEVGGVSYVYVFGDALDSAVFTDTDGNDYFYGLSNTSVFVAAGLVNQVVGFGASYGYSTSGTDTSVMFDSTGDDRFYAYQGNALLIGSNYSTQAVGFSVEYGIASSGNDSAEVHDTPYNDTLVSLPSYSFFSGPGYTAVVAGFDVLNVIASTGIDAAYFYDSSGNDDFTGTPSYSTLATPDGSFGAYGFDMVIAWSIFGGNDTARFYGSSGNDTFIGQYGSSSMSDATYIAIATSFKYVYAFAGNGGTDTAQLQDSSSNDRLDASAYTVTLLDRNRGFFIVLVGFQRVDATSTHGGQDLLDVKNISFFLTWAGAWIDQNV